MSEADVVLLSPACKHLFLCNKAMVVSSSAALVLDVRYTFITAPGFVVVVWHLLGSRFSSTVIGWNHPIYFDVITYLNGYDHCEPTCTQPRVRLLSVTSCLSLEQAVKSAHFARCDSETREVSVGHADSLDQSVKGSFGIFPNLIWGSPENDHWVAVCMSQEFIRPPDHPEHTGVGYDSQSGPVPDVRFIPRRRGVIHADHAFGAVNLVSRSTTQDVAGARHQCTLMTVHGHTFVPINWHIAVFSCPFPQVCGLGGMIGSHMERSVDSINAAVIVGAVQDEERHQDEDGSKDHHPVALLSLATQPEPHAS